MSDRTTLWIFRGLALAVAVLVWFLISVERRELSSEKAVEATVTYITPRGVVLLDPLQRVTVRLRGPEREVRTLNPFMVDVIAEVPSGQLGIVELHLGPASVSLPERIDVLSIEPNVIRVEVDREASRMVVVEPRLVGQPVDGAELGRPRARPESVLVNGPESRLAELRTLPTSPISLDGRQASFEVSAAVVSTDPMISIIQPPVVTVHVPIEPPPTAEGDDEEDAGAVAPGPRSGR